jgi:glycosyltransferase involved in cell wall biosynthesis
MSLIEEKQPWVSFCMSTYKRPELLREQLHCILKQTFTNYEVVISDNDVYSSAEKIVIEVGDSRIRYYSNGENLGMVKSFNKSLERAKGEFIVMITDDDPVYPEMLQTLFDLTIKYPGYGLYQGGCEILCFTPDIAKAMRAKVGKNSCLSDKLELNEAKVFSRDEFPYVFFKGEIGALMLWSAGIVKKEILLITGGMPDYGTEYFTDHAFNVVNGSHSGCVFINKALAYQAVHGENFGFNQLRNLEKYKLTPEKFYHWIEDHMKSRQDWLSVKKYMQMFIGRAMVEFSLFIKKSYEKFNFPAEEFNKAFAQTFKLPYLRRWRYKYYLLNNFPLTANFLLQLKQKYNKP